MIVGGGKGRGGMTSLQDGLSLAQDLDRLNQLLLPLRSPPVQRLKTSQGDKGEKERGGKGGGIGIGEGMVKPGPERTE